MVSQVGLNTNVINNNVPLQLSSGNAKNTQSQNVWANDPKGFSNSVNDYSNDMMMSNLDFSAIASSVTPQQAPQQNPQVELAQNPQVEPPQTSQVASQQNVQAQPQLGNGSQNPQFTSNSQDIVSVGEGLDGYLASKDKNIEKTFAGNSYKTTNFFKTTGLVAGFLAPLATKAVGLLKGKTFTELFKFKQLAATCPLVGFAGLGLGMLVDGFINSKRAQNADLQASAIQQTQNPAQQPLSMVA